MLLGGMTQRLLGPVRAGERCVVMGWVLGGEGRKHVGAAAILGEGGTPRADARNLDRPHVTLSGSRAGPVAPRTAVSYALARGLARPAPRSRRDQGRLAP